LKRFLLFKEDHIIGPWVCEKLGVVWLPGRGHTIGMIDEAGQVIVGVLFEDFNGSNCTMHVAAADGLRWATKDFLWYVFYYPFVQLGCRRVTGVVNSSNTAARRFDEHIGFKLEATLKNACPDGDLLVYCMHKEECRWIMTEENNGKE
jgi:hypothetical protein